MNYGTMSTRVLAGLVIAVVGCIAIMMLAFARLADDKILRQHSSSINSHMGTRSNYAPCLELPDELKIILSKFPGFDQSQHSARSDSGVPGLVEVWRIDGATKEMFEFAIDENQLVGRVRSEIDNSFWQVPVSWWHPSTSNHVSYAASPGGIDDNREGLYTVVAFDSKTRDLYGLTIFNW
jgi:hypothetical protein